MIANRSMPASAVIPVLAYPDVETASRWLCQVFGFEQRLIIGNHRHQLGVGDGAVVVTGPKNGEPIPKQIGAPFAVMVRVEDVDAHHKRAARHGAVILSPPASYPYGERQYSCRDCAGHHWTFSQSIADIAPPEWGGIVVAKAPNSPDVES
ncbi:VOC family protein [Mesorhizobium sp. B2-1-5]|uniref:VOC family protein n=1 Tax=Mesorhizobium sp. B2-1-5 TaxID=2589969 RepID=UPI001126FE8F|nr:VOC family protein [Mesorhizobium sp. B2-1-5]TPM98574.1 glyoxalase [Mesorhizobium sp. B2-1-5]